MEKQYCNNNNNKKQLNMTLELTILSAEDLRIKRRSAIKSKNAFVTVRSSSAECRTATSAEGSGTHPKWNEKLAVDVAAAVTLEVRCKTAFGEKTVGSASVPVTDFYGGYAPEGSVQFLSYRLRDSKGERNGVINISVRVKVAEREHTCTGPERTTVGVPVGDSVALGMPVWMSKTCNYGNYF